MLFGILSCQKYEDKRQGIRETWLNDISQSDDAVFIVGGHSKVERIGDTLLVPAKDDYPSLPEKMYEFWTWAVTQNHEIILKCDDDTYVRIDRLPSLKNGPYIGHALLSSTKKKQKKLYYAQGGCYRIDAKLLPNIIGHYQPRGVNEDRKFGLAALIAGVRLQHEPLIQLGYPGEASPTPDNLFVTGHHISPAKMREIHKGFER